MSVLKREASRPRAREVAAALGRILSRPLRLWASASCAATSISSRRTHSLAQRLLLSQAMRSPTYAPSRPGALVERGALGEDRLPVAVEVELTVKAPRRLTEVFRAWARSREVGRRGLLSPVRRWRVRCAGGAIE